MTGSGKAVSSRNAIKHGIYSRDVVLEGESIEEFQAIVDQIGLEQGAEGLIEWSFVERMATTIWRQRRLLRAEKVSRLLDTATTAMSGRFEPIQPKSWQADAKPMTSADRQQMSQDLSSLSVSYERINRYQVALDNEFQKAVRGLREAQKHRFMMRVSLIDAESESASVG